MRDNIPVIRRFTGGGTVIVAILLTLFFTMLLVDYVFGDRKFGGNAQSITKARWIHHRSFLWDYQIRNMAYLKQSSRTPTYRSARDHTEFVCRLKQYMSRHDFISRTSKALERYFSVRPVNLEETETQQSNFVHSTRMLTQQELKIACESNVTSIAPIC